MKALIVDTNSQRVAYHQCRSWSECYEWAESFIGWNGLERLSSHKANGQLITWVKTNVQ
jgi:hypothetical protein